MIEMWLRPRIECVIHYALLLFMSPIHVLLRSTAMEPRDLISPDQVRHTTMSIEVLPPSPRSTEHEPSRQVRPVFSYGAPGSVCSRAKRLPSESLNIDHQPNGC
jgi:hypothetical protein